MGRRKVSVAIRKHKKKLNSLSNDEAEKLKNVEQLARELMARYEVSHFKFRFGYGWRSYGRCTYTTITLNLEFVLQNNILEIKNTLLHEIAHAIVSVDTGHRLIWQLKAKELGVRFHRNYHK